MKQRKKVIVVGGGVAGMSATQELAERGFDVVVYEKQPEIPGGKARSICSSPNDSSECGMRRYSWSQYSRNWPL